MHTPSYRLADNAATQLEIDPMPPARNSSATFLRLIFASLALDFRPPVQMDKRAADPRNSSQPLAEKYAPPPQSCARKTRRGCLVFINLLVMLIGMFFIGVGVAIKTQYNDALTLNTTLISAKSAENFERFAEVPIFPPPPPPNQPPSFRLHPWRSSHSALSSRSFQSLA